MSRLQAIVLSCYVDCDFRNLTPAPPAGHCGHGALHPASCARGQSSASLEKSDIELGLKALLGSRPANPR